MGMQDDAALNRAAAPTANSAEVAANQVVQPQGGRYFFTSEVFQGKRAPREARDYGFVQEAARQTPVHDQCDVLVVGGGPAGTAAALGAARAGARVIVLERYNHLGGLSTGGLVIWIDRMTDWTGERVIAGVAKELMDRMPKSVVAGPPMGLWGSKEMASVAYWRDRTAAFHNTVTWSPTVCPEHLKTVSQELLLEAGVKIIFHAWGTQPMMEGQRVIGAFFESKQGRRAIKAKVVIDATGDGDLYSQAGCGFDSDINGSDMHHCTNTSWLFGGVDMPQWIEFKSQRPEEYSAFMAAGRAEVGSFEKPVVSWRNDLALFMGPRQAGFKATDVEDLTEVEIASRRLMMKHLDFFKKNAPGFEGAYLLMMAPQIGVRHSRRLHAIKAVTRAQWDTGLVHEDEIAVCPSLSPVFPNISIPYAALVPREVEGLLAPGKHMSCDANSHSFLREIPECWLTGHGAGVAAALAVQLGVALRDLPIEKLQTVLREQGAIVRATPSTALANANPEIKQPVATV